MEPEGSTRDLAELLVEGYGRAYRTAYLITRNPADAEEAVQEAFLRVWRFRGSLPDGQGIQPWIYRVLVNTCYSQLRKETIPNVTPREDCMTAMCFVRSTGVGSGISSAGIAAGPGALSA